MGSPTKVFLSLIAALLLTALVSRLAIYAINLSTRHKAEALLAEIQHWQPSETTFEETAPVRALYVARRDFAGASTGSPSEAYFSIDVFSSLLNSIGFKFSRLRSLGIKPLGVEVRLTYSQDRLRRFSYALYTTVVEASGQPTEIVEETRVEQDSLYGSHPEYRVGYYSRPSPIAAKAVEYRFGAVITPTATDEERKAAFDFDLSCMSSLRGCEALCEVMPSVWKEAVRRFQNKEIPLPLDELAKPECANLSP